MLLIKLFVLGAIGYLLSGLYDLAILYGWRFLRWIMFPGFFITALPYVFLLINYDSPHTPCMQAVLVVPMVCFVMLLIYSVLVEIPLRSKKRNETYKGGTYGFSRHPGFIWYTVLNILVAIFIWDEYVLILCIGLIGCNVLLITIEDVFVFPKLFADYKEYKRQTPFLFPLRNLIRRREKK